jgi:hypothetical protein
VKVRAVLKGARSGGVRSGVRPTFQLHQDLFVMWDWDNLIGCGLH